MRDPIIPDIGIIIKEAKDDNLVTRDIPDETPLPPAGAGINSFHKAPEAIRDRSWSGSDAMGPDVLCSFSTVTPGIDTIRIVIRKMDIVLRSRTIIISNS